MSNYNNPLTNWLKDQIGQQALASVVSGQVSPDSTIGQSILAQHPIPSMATGNPSLNMIDPLSAAALQQGAPPQPTQQQFTQGMAPPNSNQVGQSLPVPGGVGLPSSPPMPPQRPANFAGSGLQAFHNNINSNQSIPLPPPRPAGLGQPQPSANDLIWDTHKHGLFPNIFHALSGPVSTIGNGIGGALSGLFGGGQPSPASFQANAAPAASSNPLSGILSGLFG